MSHRRQGATWRRGVRSRRTRNVNPTTILKALLMGWYPPEVADVRQWVPITVGGASLVPTLISTADVALSATGGPTGGAYVRFTNASLNQMYYQGALGSAADRPWIMGWFRARNTAVANRALATIAGGTPTFHLHSFRAGTTTFRDRVLDSSQGPTNVDVGAYNNDWHWLEAGHDGTNFTISIDNGTPVTLPANGSMDLTSPGSRFVLGASTTGGGDGQDCDWADVITTHGAPTADQRAAVRKYFGA